MSKDRKEDVGLTGALFAAANSGRGFKSFYSEIFDREEIARRYLIKGGPGTGKSSFMRKLGAIAEEQGRSVAYYRCSFDPDSLDAIVIDDRIAVIDATAPHTIEPKAAGARDEIVNLGEFWNSDRLAEHYNEIVAYSALKESAYRKAYRFLSAALELSSINRELVEPHVLEQKLCAAVERQMRTIEGGTQFCARIGLCGSIGMKGRVRFDTYERSAKRLFVIDDCYGIGTRYLSHLIEGARKKKCSIVVSYQALDPSLPDAVYFEQSGDCFILWDSSSREPDGRINMKRFLASDGLPKIRSEYRLNARLYEAMLASAKDALGEAGRYHLSLESVYVSCMDFSSQEQFLQDFSKKI